MNHPGSKHAVLDCRAFIELVISLIVGAALAFVMMIFLTATSKAVQSHQHSIGVLFSDNLSGRSSARFTLIGLHGHGNGAGQLAGRH
jgi:hypothetical protein